MDDEEDLDPDETNKYYGSLEKVFKKMSAKLEYYDPLERPIIPADEDEDEDEGDMNQAISTDELKKKIFGLKPVACKEFQYPMNEELKHSIDEVVEHAKSHVIDICCKHHKLAKKEGQMYKGDVESDARYLEVLNDFEFLERYDLI